MVSKGKQVAGKGSSGKRKREDNDKTGRPKRKNPGVLQFFEDAAFEVDESDASEDSDDFFGDFLEDEFGTEVKSEPGKAPQVPIFPKEEELSEEELDRILQERYKPGSSFLTYAEDGYESKRSVERNAFIPSSKDPTIWKVKCMVGRERHSAFCLMQKYVDLHSIGTKLQIVSAFALEHVKGFIYIEADKQNEVYEACKGLCSIYSSRVAPVPKNEVSHLLSVRSKCNEVSQGSWARVKNGIYKGDLAQVMGVNHARKKATVKLIPRIDIQALNEKFGGGVKSKKAAIPAPRLISSSELEEFRPLIQCKRDRDTGEVFEVLDGMMLKDGYLYKKVSLDSLSCWGVVPSEEELLKFEISKKGESDDVEWLSRLYGEQKKKRTITSEKGGGKGECSSSSSMANKFDVHDLVFFGRKDFGVIIGTEKDDSFKILREGSEGPVVVTIEQRQLKNASFDKKLTALDHRMKTILINDTVKVIEGPLKGRQGIVKHIYRGTIFLCDDNEVENGGYFCCKSLFCEKNKLSDEACKGKGGESECPGFEGFCSSPKSPLSPEKPWQSGEDKGNFKQGDKDGMFSVGQSLRIRVGPLKGYLCRVLAIRRSDVTVKLDSQQKVLTVKSEHLSEVRGKTSTISFGDDADSVKPFDLLGTQDGSKDWGDGVGTSSEGGRSSWPAFPSSSFSLHPESSSANPFDSVHMDPNKDVKDDAWEIKVAPNKNSSWGTSVAEERTVANNEQAKGWGNSSDSWNKAAATSGFGSTSTGSWGKAKVTSGDQTGSLNNSGDTWGKAKLTIGTPDDISKDVGTSWGQNTVSDNNQDNGWKKSAEPWDKGTDVNRNPASSWNHTSGGKNSVDSWGKGKEGESGGSDWGKALADTGKNVQEDSWGKAAEKLSISDGSDGSRAVWSSSTATPNNQTGGWGSAATNLVQPEAVTSGWKKGTGASAGQSENFGNSKKDGEGGWGKGGSTWGKAMETQERDGSKGIQEDSWGKAAEKWSSKGGPGENKTAWNSAAATENRAGGWGSAAGSSAQPEAEASGWKKASGTSGGRTESWGNMKKDSEDAAGRGSGVFDNEKQTPSWSKPKDFGAGRGSSWDKQDGGSSWGKGGGSWSKQTGGSSWGNQAGADTKDESRGTTDPNASWDTAKSYGGDRGFGGWDKGGEGTNFSDGGRGSGGRRGRGGGRGGRDQFGRGRSFGRGQSSGWSKEGEDNYRTGDGKSAGDHSSWNEGKSGGWGNDKASDGVKNDFGWNKSSASGGGSGSNWSKGFDANKTVDESGGSKGQGDGWGSGTSGSGGGNWTSFKTSDGSQSQSDGWNTGKASALDQATGWKSGTSETASGQSNWGAQKVPQETSGWNQKSAESDKNSESKGQNDGWDIKKTSDGGSTTGWGQSSKWNSGAKGAGETQNSGWGSNSNWTSQSAVSGSGNNDTGRDQNNSWANKSNWNSGDQNNSWGNKSNWNSGDASGGSENQTDTYSNRGRGGNWRGGRGRSDRGGFGRGSSDGGGFGGRWSSDRGGYGGRGRSERGGFQGRGGSDRGGDFGGRGRGRREYGGNWNNRSDSGENKPSDWNKGSDNNSDAWRSSGGGSWNQSGDGKDQWKSWNSSPNPSKSANENTGADGEWKKGTDFTKTAGGTDAAGGGWNSGQASGWNNTSARKNETGEDKNEGSKWGTSSASAGAQSSGSWNQVKTPDGDRSSGWNQPKDVKGLDEGAPGSWNQSKTSDEGQSSGWNKPNQGSGWGGASGSGTGNVAGSWNEPKAADGDLSSGWNQPKDVKGASEDGGKTTNSWGKGNGGGGKGGW